LLGHLQHVVAETLLSCSTSAVTSSTEISSTNALLFQNLLPAHKLLFCECFGRPRCVSSVQVLLEMRSGGHVGAAARTWHPKDVLPCSELDNLFYFFLKVGVLLLDRILHRYINAFYHPTIIFFCGQQLGRAPAAHVDGPRHWPNKAKQGGQLDTLQLYLQGTARTTGLRAIKRPSHNHVACIACEVFSQICVL